MFKVTSITKEIVEKSEALIKKYDLDKYSLQLDYVDIFPQNEYEYTKLTEEIKTLGKPAFETSTGKTYKLKSPINTTRGTLNLLRIRIYDQNKSSFRGHPDYKVKDYEKTKRELSRKNNVNIIKRTDYEMIEILDNEFEVLIYIPNIPLSSDLN